MKERAFAVSGSSDDASCSLWDEYVGMSDDFNAEEQEAEGVAETYKEHFWWHLMPLIQTRRRNFALFWYLGTQP